MNHSRTPPRQGYLCMDGWAGRHDYACMVIGETAKRYRIKAMVDIKLPQRWLKRNEEALVPKTAVRII